MTIIAIDGPAASGKGTLGARLAGYYGLPHLDTGLIYRAVAAGVLARGHRIDDAEAAAAVARGLVASDLCNPALRGREMGEAASVVAAFPAVREALVAFQRAFAAQPGGAVLDGRDIGTVICPDADVKLYVTAAAEVRARRRWQELRAHGEEPVFDAILGDILRRDGRDASRASAPLKPAPDARLLDTSEMDIDTAFRAAVALVDGA
ncbi:MAG TPA: (d)CMP kinase [Hyphomicrobiales bacterium]|nr:(d)CMP kinase [Hyphomicrobiales bacterium]